MNLFHKSQNPSGLLPALFVIVFSLCLQPAYAQQDNKDIGIGVQIGQPSGVTLKIYNDGMSLDFLAAWDFNDFVFLNLHGIFEIPLVEENTIHFLYGPGVYTGVRDRGFRDSEIELGISGTVGINFIIDQFEIYLHATPRFSIIESTDFDMGGGLGVRFYL